MVMPSFEQGGYESIAVMVLMARVACSTRREAQSMIC